MTRSITLLCILFGLLAAASAHAQAPGVIPVQGVLVDSAGVPLDGDYSFTMTLYGDSAGATTLATETQTVTVNQGYFTAFFGSTGPIDPTTFRDSGGLYLGLAIDSDPEMLPLFEVGTAPWAGYSEYAGEADDAVMLGGQPASAYRLGADPIDFSALTNIPPDEDTLASLGCTDGQIAQWNNSGGAWICGTVSATGVETDPVFGTSAAAGITTGDIAAWGLAETDPVFGASPASGITGSQVSNWDVAYGWGDHAAAGYFSAGGGTVSGNVQVGGTVTATGFAGNGSALTNLNELDPVFGASAAGGITTGDINNWNSSTDTLAGLSCIDGQVAQYSTSLAQWICATVTASGTENDPVFVASPAGSITSGQVGNWNSAYGWGNHASASYLSSETDPLWTSFQGVGGTVSGTVTAAGFVGDGSGLTGLTDADTLGGMSCVPGEVAVWNGANWGCGAASAVETDPLWTAFETGGGMIGGDVSLGFGTMTAGAFIGDGSGLTGLTDNDTLGGLLCGLNEVPLWNGAFWGCAPGSGPETDPVFGLSAAAGITVGDISTWSVDNDTLGGLICGLNEVPLWNGVFWGCAPGPGIETDPVFGISAAAGITTGDISAWSVDADTLGGLSCSNGQVAQWSGSVWTCATVSGGGTETDPVWAAFQASGGTISGNVTTAGALPKYSWDPTGSPVGYDAAAYAYAIGGVDYADWDLKRTTASTSVPVLSWDDLNARLAVGGGVYTGGTVTGGSFVGDGSGLTGLTDNDTLGGLSCSNG